MQEEAEVTSAPAEQLASEDEHIVSTTPAQQVTARDEQLAAEDERLAAEVEQQVSTALAEPLVAEAEHLASATPAEQPIAEAVKLAALAMEQQSASSEPTLDQQSSTEDSPSAAVDGTGNEVSTSDELDYNSRPPNILVFAGNNEEYYNSVRDALTACLLKDR